MRSSENIIIEYEIIELEVCGVTINIVRRPKEIAMEYIKDFYARYGTQGVAYIRRGSRMNYKSLIDQYEPEPDLIGSEEGY